MLGQLFTYFLALIGAAGGWLYPVFGLMVYYAFAVLRPTDLWFWNKWDFTRMSMVVAASTLIGWAIAGFGKADGLKYARLPLLGLGLYLLGGTIAWVQSPLGATPRAWEYLVIQYKIGLMALVTLMLVREPRQIRTFAWVLLATLGYLAWEFNYIYKFQGWNRVYWRGFGGIDNNGIAMVMVMGVPLAFFLGLHVRALWAKVLCFAIVLMLIHVVLFSYSRGAQLGLIMVGGALFYIAVTRLPRKGRTVALGAVALTFAIWFAGDQVREEFWSIFADADKRDASAESRFTAWSAAWECMKDHPLGVGPRNFNRMSNRYGLPINKSVHNLFLQTGADYGFMGMFGLALFYVSTMWQTYRMANTPTARRLEWPHYFAHMVAIALGGFLMCSMFIGIESVETGYMIALLGLCTNAYVIRATIHQPAPESVPELAEVPAADEDYKTQPA